MAARRRLLGVAWSRRRIGHGERPCRVAAPLAAMPWQIGLSRGGTGRWGGAVGGIGTAFASAAGMTPTRSEGPVAVSIPIPDRRHAAQPRACAEFRPISRAGGTPVRYHRHLRALAEAWQGPLRSS